MVMPLNILKDRTGISLIQRNMKGTEKTAYLKLLRNENNQIKEL
jgi:tRNA(Ser,Leu) C12 N-acetylase TAN1